MGPGAGAAPGPAALLRAGNPASSPEAEAGALGLPPLPPAPTGAPRLELRAAVLQHFGAAGRPPGVPGGAFAAAAQGASPGPTPGASAAAAAGGGGPAAGDDAGEHLGERGRSETVRSLLAERGTISACLAQQLMSQGRQ